MASKIEKTVWGLMGLCWGGLMLSPAVAQTNPLAPTVQEDRASRDEGIVDLSFEEAVPLATLVEYVGREMNLSFIYEPSVLQGEVQLTIRGPLPVASLEGLLATALRMNGLTVIESGTPGIKRIVGSDQSHLTLRKDGGDGVGPPRPAEAFSVVTRVFRVNNEAASDVAQALRPLLANPDNLLYFSDVSGVVVVADQAAVIDQMEELVAKIDGGGRDAEIRVLPLRHAVARDLAEQVTLVMEARMSAGGAFQTDSREGAGRSADESAGGDGFPRGAGRGGGPGGAAGRAGECGAGADPPVQADQHQGPRGAADAAGGGGLGRGVGPGGRAGRRRERRRGRVR